MAICGFGTKINFEQVVCEIFLSPKLQLRKIKNIQKKNSKHKWDDCFALASAIIDSGLGLALPQND